MFEFTKQPLNVNQPSHESEWMSGPNGLEAIVFVHGILGDKTETWGKFPELIATDRELPLFDVLCWGYRSGLVPGSYQDVASEADGLMSDLRLLTKNDEDIFLIAHSMGGLVLLKGVVLKVLNGEGKVHPVSSIQLITLYATPLHGSSVADVLVAGAQLHRYSRLAMKLLPGKQLKDLRKGEFVQRLLRDTNDHVYRPPADNPLVERNIPVQVCTAKRDAVVSRDSAIGIFSRDPSPIHLEGTHSSVKQPDHHLDHRYLAFKENLNERLKHSFTHLCLTIMTEPDRARRLEGLERFNTQYGELVERCGQACFPGRELSDRDREEIGGSLIEFGSRGGLTPEDVYRGVVRDCRYDNDSRFTGREW